MARVLARQVGGEPLEYLDIVPARLPLAVVPERLGVPAVQDGAPQGCLELVPLGPDGRRFRAGQQRRLGHGERGPGVPGPQGHPGGQEVGVDLGAQPVRLGADDLLAELRPQPVYLRPCGGRVAVLAVELQRELLGGQPGGMQGQQG